MRQLLSLKKITEPFLEAVLENQQKIIVHATCTGYAQSILEPNVIPASPACHPSSRVQTNRKNEKPEIESTLEIKDILCYNEVYYIIWLFICLRKGWNRMGQYMFQTKQRLPELQKQRESDNPEKLNVAAMLGNKTMLALLSQSSPTITRSSSQTGGEPLADMMRAKFERQFGLPMSDVRIHRNSDKPAKFNADAYTYGSDIFMGPGQEDTLEHEMTHVAQQKLGQVHPMGIKNGMAINYSPILEHNADTGTVIQTMGTATKAVVQCCGGQSKKSDRVSTFYGYVSKNLRFQGPHTVSHIAIVTLVDNTYWGDTFDESTGQMQPGLFSEQILPYNPGRIQDILLSEGINEKNFPGIDEYMCEYMQEYTELYNFLDDCSKYNRFPEEQPDPTQEQDCAKYQEIRSKLIRIMEMHPYATYSWHNCTPSKAEMQGKGERSANLKDILNSSADSSRNKELISEIMRKHIDYHASFYNQDEYMKFLQIRIGGPIDKDTYYSTRAKLFADEMGILCSNVAFEYNFLQSCKAIKDRFEYMIMAGIEGNLIIHRLKKLSYDHSRFSQYINAIIRAISEFRTLRKNFLHEDDLIQPFLNIKTLEDIIFFGDKVNSVYTSK